MLWEKPYALPPGNNLLKVIGKSYDYIQKKKIELLLWTNILQQFSKLTITTMKHL